MRMKILYGVQGTGNGHITRARVMAKALAKHKDVQVDYLFSGRAPDQYFDMQVFGDYQTRHGLSFVTQNGKVSKYKTLKQARLARLIADIQRMDMSDYDLVINDFEPVSAWAAQLRHVPSISISHQACFLSQVPKRGKGLMDELLLRHFAPTTYQLGVHWYHFGQHIVPPFIEHSGDDVELGEHILVYLPFEELDAIRNLLLQFPKQQFRVFHPAVKAAKPEHNIDWHPPGKQSFHQALRHAAGVIANAGFELSSECLHLGKKLLLKPLLGQFEQLSNVLTLEKLGRCHTMNSLQPEIVSNWLSSAPAEPVRFPGQADLLVDWLLEERWFDSTDLCRELWQQVNFPSDVRARLAGF